jgi:high affinity sulfate transporter 1
VLHAGLAQSDLVPSVGWLRQYRGGWLRADLTAGLTAAAVVVPKAMAFATIAGLPVQVGLYTAIVPMVVYALLGTSRALSVSTTTTLAILVAAALARVAPAADTGTLLSAAATLAILTGAMLALAAMLRLGFVADFISEPVLTGFKSGIGLVIVVDQIPKLLGVHIDKAGFFHDVVAIAAALPHASRATLLAAASVLALIFGLGRFVPRAPAPLIAIAIAILVSSLLGLSDAGVATVGTIPGDLPTWTWPRLDLVQQMWPAAAGIALMSFTETIAAGHAFSAPGEPRPVPNQELLAVGLGNIAGGFFGAMPSGGGTTQTAVNRKAGARTQVAELVTAAGAVAMLLLLAPALSLMPQAALAAIVVAYSVDLIRPAEFREIRRVRYVEFGWALIAFAGVVLLGTLDGILVAMSASLLAMAHQANHPPVYALGRKRGTQVFRPLSQGHPDDETWPGLLILRTEGRLFFANAQRVFDMMRSLIDGAGPSIVLLDCSAVTDIEYTAIKMLLDAEQKLRQEGVTVWLAALNPGARAVVQRSSLAATLGDDRMFFNVAVAVERYEQLAFSTAPPPTRVSERTGM